MAAPQRVLFVCLGNICRSPAAEGVFRHLAHAAGRDDAFRIQSAGTAGYHVGALPDRRMREAAQARGITLASRARTFTAKDFVDFDQIWVMDAQNERDVLALAPDDAARAKVRPFAQLLGDPNVAHIPDPYYGGPEGFDHVLDLLERGCARLLTLPPACPQ